MTTALPALYINSARLRDDFDRLAQIGATVGGGISRLALSNEDLQARAWFASQLEDVGFEVYDDDAGNLSGILRSERPASRTLLVGSHLDTVPNGGRFDGSVGVLAALECLRTIAEAGIKLPVHLEVIDFTDEEGCWQSLLGSQGLTGRLQPTHINDKVEDHAAFRAALIRAGIHPNDIFSARRDAESLVGFVELHIEQGSRLDRAGVDIGLVTAIVGRTTCEITFLGEAGHSGTTDRDERKDALLGAARFISQAHEMVRRHYDEGVFNCGNVRVHPGAFNIIPSKVCLTMEFRHPDESQMVAMEQALIALSEDCAEKHGLKVQARQIVHMPAATMSTPMLQAAERACQSLGVSYMRTIGYAGHDVQIMSSFTPSAMIFIPSVDGVSHNPREYSHWEQVEKGANVLLHTLLNIALSGAES